MNWKTKAIIQNMIARLPERLSLPTYYFLQRRFGGLREINHAYTLSQGCKILKHVVRQRRPITSRVFLEVGTGRGLNVPIVLWLCGAGEVITVDVNPYLRRSIVFDLIEYIGSHRDQVCEMLSSYVDAADVARRLDQLVQSKTLHDVLALTQTRYLAPADAATLPLPSDSIDYHVSSTVFEHVPPATLEAILREGRRLIRGDGLFIHGVGLSDHFAHSDSSISSINFLRFGEEEWARYAGNRFMYHNRLRLDDYLALFERAGIGVVDVVSSVDPRAVMELQAGFPLAPRFQGKTIEANATCDAGFVGIGRPSDDVNGVAMAARQQSREA